MDETEHAINYEDWISCDQYKERETGILGTNEQSNDVIGNAAGDDANFSGWARQFLPHQNVDLNQYMSEHRRMREEEIKKTRVRVLDDVNPLESNESLLARFNALDQFFFGDETLTTSDLDILRIIRRFFGISDDNEICKGEHIKTIWEKRIQLIESLRDAMLRRRLASTEETDHVAFNRLKKLMTMESQIATGYHGLVSIENYRDIGDRRNRLSLPPTIMTILQQPMTDAKGNPKQPNESHRVISFLLAYCQKNKLRKDRQGLGYYREKKNKKGVGVHTFGYSGELEKLPFEASKPRSANPEIWRCLVYRAGIARHAVDYLSKCADHELPELVKSRRTWAFENGIYIGFQDQFYEHGDPRLTDDVVACKYFPVEFENDKYIRQSYKNSSVHPDWMDIDTPLIDQILRDQGLSDEVIEWFYVLSGKLAYKIRELDNWQVQMFIKGLAGTGKSSLLQQLIYLWDPIDVGYISNIVERNFPLEGLLHAFVYFGLDVSSQFGLDQTLWQSMVTGEGIAVTRKFKSRISIDWETPGALAGNQTPPWKDNAGSVSRRLIIFEFMQYITESASRPTMQEDMRRDIGAFIKKISCAYGDVGLHLGLESFWSLVPRYFKDTRAKLRKETNLLESFISSAEHCVLHKSLAIPLNQFYQQFKLYCVITREKKTPAWTEEYYMGVFHHNNLRVDRRQNAEYGGKIVNGNAQWIFGIDHVTNVDQSKLSGDDVEVAERTRQQYDQEEREAKANYSALATAPTTGVSAGAAITTARSGSVTLVNSNPAKKLPIPDATLSSNNNSNNNTLPSKSTEMVPTHGAMLTDTRTNVVAVANIFGL